MVDDGEEGDPEDSDHGTILAAPEMSTPVESDHSMSKLKSEFNFKEFFELAMRVIEIGDTESMSALKELKRKWMEKFGGELETGVHGGLRPVQSRRPTPYPSRPARRCTRLPTSENAANIVNSAALTDIAAPKSNAALTALRIEEPTTIMEHRNSLTAPTAAEAALTTSNEAPKTILSLAAVTAADAAPSTSSRRQTPSWRMGFRWRLRQRLRRR
ncbi:UNVERIFIED_CONTAM: hypothetical protein Sangu_3170400 [Sesamum angustifolium]|uniref:Uncharacterized protein n=1 Tax=Sesamum angustifolium TaxID=2727405 RepID=A0AAW2JTJ2_9LAMI